MADGGVAKHGDVTYLARGIRKAWHKRYCALHRKCPDAHPYIELFETKKQYEEGKKPEKKVELQNVKLYKSIQKTSKGEECQLTLHCKSGKHTLGFSSEDETNDWEWWFQNIVDICTDKGADESSGSSHMDAANGDTVVTENLMYQTTNAEKIQQYDVIVEENKFTKLNDLIGKKKLLISGCDLALQDPQSRSIIGSWPFSSIRRYGLSKQTFLFEGGRHCQLGEGIVHCQSNSYKEIHAYVLHQAQQSSRAMRRLQDESAQGHEVEDQQRNSITRKSAGDYTTPADKKPSQQASSEDSPSLIVNLKGRHAGPKNLQTLTPLNTGNTQNTMAETRSPVKEKDLRLSTPTVIDEPKGKTDIPRSLSIDPHIASKCRHKAPAEYEFVKGLEGKIKQQIQNTEAPPTVLTRPESVKSSRKPKEEKKDDGGGEKGGILNFFSRKKSKDKSKHAEPANPAPPVCYDGAYEETDIVMSPPVQPMGKDDLYDEAVSPIAKQGPPVTATEYAKPYTQTIIPGSGTYEEVETLRREAWQSYGRQEEEETHTEEYLNIKEAREQKEAMGVNAPPLPDREYSSEEVEDDETYDRAVLRGTSGSQRYTDRKSDSTYGMASGKPITPQQGNIYGTASGHTVSQTYEGVGDPDDTYNTCGDDDGYMATRTKCVSTSNSQPAESLYDSVE